MRPDTNSTKQQIMQTVGAENLGFKTVFLATLGFYSAQLLISLLSIAVIFGGGGLALYLLSRGAN